MNFQHKGTFESKRVNNIYEYGVYGKTVKHRLYAGDKKERYFHLYHSISKESAERAGIENRLNQMTLYLKKYQNKVKEFGPGFEKYFNLHYDEKTQAFVLPEERCSVVERELDLAGYFCIITSEKMSAKEAIELYKSRDTSEKLFRGDKSSTDGKQFMADNSQRESARWQEALDLLITWGWVKPVGRKGEVYEVTGTGYTKADWLKDDMCIDTSKEPLEELKQFEF